MPKIGIDCRKIADFGIGAYIQGLLRGLQAIDGDESYVLFGPAGVAPGWLTSNRFVWTPEESPHYSLRELVRVGRLIGQQGLDLFHAPHYVIPFTRCRTVVTIHDLIHLELTGRPLAAAYARVMLGRAVHNSSAILTVSQASKNAIVSRWKKAEGKIFVTSNRVRPDHFEPVSHEAMFNVLGKFSLERERFFLFVGNDKPHKNLDRLVEAFRLFRRELPSWKLAIVGSRPDRFAETEGVVLCGFVSEEDLLALYASALALVQPSLLEGFGLPVAEAMAHGLAVITSNDPALVEVSGDAALHVNALSEASIVEAMKRLAHEPETRASLARQGRVRAEGMSWDAMARATLDVYRQVLAR